MKILLIAPQPFFRIRGTPINVRNVATALRDGGHEITLLCYPFGDEPEDFDGIKIVRGPRCPGIKDVKIGPSLAKIPLDLLLFVKAWHLCRKSRYEVIHAVEESVFFAVWLKRWFKTELIYDMDSVISDQLAYSGKLTSSWALNRIMGLEKWAIRHARFVLTVCESLSDTTRSLVPDAHIVQIEDAPVDEAFEPDPVITDRIRKENQLSDQPVIVYTGNLESYQGVDMVVEAAPTVCQSFPDCRFLLVGGQADQIAQLNQRAVELKVSTQIIFAGIRPVHEMASYMEAADILISPRKEGTNTALKIYSYMQSGKPIVATDMATHTQVLDSSSAVLVAPTPDAIASGILDVLSDKTRADQLGATAARCVEERYSLSHFKRRVLEAYETFSPIDIAAD